MGPVGCDFGATASRGLEFPSFVLPMKHHLKANAAYPSGQKCLAYGGMVFQHMVDHDTHVFLSFTEDQLICSH